MFGWQEEGRTKDHKRRAEPKITTVVKVGNMVLVWTVGYIQPPAICKGQ